MIDDRFLADSPEEVGIDSLKLQALLDRCKHEVDDRLLPSAQICLARNGKVVAFETYGDADNNSLYCIFSATKAITSAAIWQLVEEKKLNISDKACTLVPEFGTHGKEAISVEQLLTHTAGFPHAPFRPTDWNDKTRRNERYSSWTLDWEPGSRFEYHPTSSMWVLAEIIERLSGESFQQYLRNHIAEPLGLLDMWVGCPQQEHQRIAPVIHVGESLSSEDYKALGVPEPPVTEVTEEALSAFNTSAVRQVPVAGGGGVMSAAELALFYQALIQGGKSLDGEVIWQPQTLKMATKVRTGTLKDPLLGHIVNRALGVIVAGDETRNHRGFGHTNSPYAFGHSGAGGQLGWADPQTGISIGYCTNGHDRNSIRQARRGISISNKAAVCTAG